MNKYAIWGLCAVGQLVLFGSIFGLVENREGAMVLANNLVKADKHQFALLGSGSDIVGAEFNLAVVSRSAEYITTLGSNTDVYRQILKIAGNLEFECPALNRVLDLAVVHQGDADRVLRLANSACPPDSSMPDDEWEAEFKYLWETADYDSIEQAVAEMSN